MLKTVRLSTILSRAEARFSAPAFRPARSCARRAAQKRKGGKTEKKAKP